MGAADLLHRVRAAGFTLGHADGKLLVTPASMLTDDLRAALRACKPELIQLLTEPPTQRPFTELDTALTAAIHRACDARGDDAANRVGLLSECAALPSEGQADMLAHFTLEAARWGARP